MPLDTNLMQVTYTMVLNLQKSTHIDTLMKKIGPIGTETHELENPDKSSLMPFSKDLDNQESDDWIEGDNRFSYPGFQPRRKMSKRTTMNKSSCIHWRLWIFFGIARCITFKFVLSNF